MENRSLTASPMPSRRAATEPRPPAQRSGTSAWSRRYADLIAGHVADMAGGEGSDALSEAQLSLIKRASAIEVELEQMEGRLSMGESVDLDAFTRAASHLRRILESLHPGLERKPRDVTSLGEVLRGQRSAVRP